MTTKDVLIDAINHHHVLSVRYDGYQRVIEPHVYGTSDKGETLLRCWQVSSQKLGSIPGWKLLDASRLTDIQPTGAEFSSARYAYNRDDPAITRIYARL